MQVRILLVLLVTFGCSRLESGDLAPTVPGRQTLVIIVVDTLRADRLGTYGHGEPLTPAIDAWAQGAIVFENARSVAPWTLPSVRAVLSGRQPERYDPAISLQSELQSRGWSAALVGANAYLVADYRMDIGWNLHDVVPGAPGRERVARAMSWLRDHRDQDRFLLLHLMDCHEPYAGDGQVGGDEPSLRLLRNSPTRVTDEDRRSVRARYDAGVRVVDAALAPLLSALPDDAVVAFLADHGEELWDHGGYEHGHTLFDELLHVPLMMKLPGMPPGRVAAPVSLLDVAPTVIGALGLSGMSFDGSDLAPSARGDMRAASVLLARPIGLGRLLYGGVQWGVVHRGFKYVVAPSGESLFDLTADPGEARPHLLSGPSAARWRRLLADAIGANVRRGFRLTYTRGQHVALETPLVAELRVPGGVTGAGCDYGNGLERAVGIEHSTYSLLTGGSRSRRSPPPRPNNSGRWATTLTLCEAAVRARPRRGVRGAEFQIARYQLPPGPPYPP